MFTVRSMTIRQSPAAADAASLRGDAEVGVEEIGEHFEHFPPKDYDARFVNRRRAFLDDDRT